ncbi:hypothetical protein ACXYMO_08750 [Arenibacterium sp. CAU 1754]
MALAALWFGRWPIAFVSLATLCLSLVPVIVARRLSITLPGPYLVATTLFIFASIFLGEAFDFYNKLWWWDLALHAASAIGFGLLGFLFIFTVFNGDRYAAPPIALSFMAFCVAVTIGSLWEIFEFLMDQALGLSMQKSGLVDSMTDLILNALGAAFAGLSGYLYLIGRRKGGLGPHIDSFIRLNRKLYKKSRDRLRR